MPSQQVVELLQQVLQAHNTDYPTREPDSDLTPMYMLYRGTQCHTVAVIADMAESGDFKRALAARMGQLAEEAGCDAYSFSCEAYTIPPEAARLRQLGLTPPNQRFADRPDRIELLTVEVGTAAGETAVQTAVIHRSADAAPRLEWREPMYSGTPGVRLQSRFNIFNPQEPTSGPEVLRPALQ